MSLCVLALAFGLAGYDGTPTSDADQALTLSMIMLSFPAGLLYAALFAVIARTLHESTGVVVESSYWSMTLSWLAMLLLGYIQWFVVVPWLSRRLRARRGGAS